MASVLSNSKEEVEMIISSRELGLSYGYEKLAESSVKVLDVIVES